jgi:hypothetical protein
MSEFQTHPVPANFKDAHINAEKYQAMYKRSIEDPEGFFGFAQFATGQVPGPGSNFFRNMFGFGG